MTSPLPKLANWNPPGPVASPRPVAPWGPVSGNRVKGALPPHTTPLCMTPSEQPPVENDVLAAVFKKPFQTMTRSPPLSKILMAKFACTKQKQIKWDSDLVAELWEREHVRVPRRVKKMTYIDLGGSQRSEQQPQDNSKAFARNDASQSQEYHDYSGVRTDVFFFLQSSLTMLAPCAFFPLQSLLGDEKYNELSPMCSKKDAPPSLFGTTRASASLVIFFQKSRA